jgi:hypothetical protein
MYATTYANISTAYVYKSSNGTTWSQVYNFDTLADNQYYGNNNNTDVSNLNGPITVDGSGNVYYGHGANAATVFWYVESSSNGGVSFTPIDELIAMSNCNGATQSMPHAMVVLNGSLYTVGIEPYSSAGASIPTVWVMRKSPLGSTLSGIYGCGSSAPGNTNSYSVDYYNYSSGQQSIPYGITSANGHLYMVGTGNDASGNPHWLTRTF